MEPTKRGPFNRVLRTFRRQRGLVVAPDLPPPDAQRVLKVIEDLLAQRETNAQRATAETLLQVYGGFDADGRRRFLELLATQLGADPEALDRAAEQLRARRRGPLGSRRSVNCGLRSSHATRPCSTWSRACRWGCGSSSSSAPIS